MVQRVWQDMGASHQGLSRKKAKDRGIEADIILHCPTQANQMKNNLNVSVRKLESHSVKEKWFFDKKASCSSVSLMGDL